MPLGLIVAAKGCRTRIVGKDKERGRPGDKEIRFVSVSPCLSAPVSVFFTDGCQNARRSEPASTGCSADAQGAAAGAGRRGHGQDACRYLSHRRVDPASREAGADSGRHVHQKGGRRNAGAGQRAASHVEGRSRSRVSPKLGHESRKDATPTPEISTFHSLCVRILRRHIKQLGFPEKFVICDRNEQESQARTALRELRAPIVGTRAGRYAVDRQPVEVGVACGPTQAIEIAHSEREHLAAAAYRRYQENLKRVGAVDFDDLLASRPKNCCPNSRPCAGPKPRGSITC